MKIIIRTDSSKKIASGHMTRCLTLANKLKNQGADVSFISRNLKKNLNHRVEENNFQLHTLPDAIVPDKNSTAEEIERFTQIDLEQCEQLLQSSSLANRVGQADWIIVDHYSLDQRWEKQMRSYAKRIMAIDDLANRKHDCDLLLDQNLFDKLESRYDDLTPVDCTRLLGPNYALLRDEFGEAKQSLRHRTGQMNQLFVFLGASNSNDVLGKVLDGLELLKRPELKITLIVGKCGDESEVTEIMERGRAIPNCASYIEASNFEELIASADLAIGAGGSTTWERCCLGLPTLFIATTPNEVELARTCGANEIGLYLGDYSEIDGPMIDRELTGLFDQPEKLRRWGENASKLVDGKGAERVCDKIYSLTKEPVA